MDGDAAAPAFELSGLPLDLVLPRSPFRSPAWRWLIAEHYAEQERTPSPLWFDSWVIRACEYSTRGPIAAEFFDAEREGDWLPIHRAALLRGATNQLPRFELEARILTGATTGQIAELCGLDQRLVEAYEHLFYDARRKLNNRSYVLHQLIGPKLQLGFESCDLDLIWKLIAYNCGNVALDAILDATWFVDRPARLDDVAEFFNSHPEAAAARSLFLSILTLQANELDLRDIGNLLAALRYHDGTATAIKPTERLLALPTGRARMEGPQKVMWDSVIVSRRLNELTESGAAESPALTWDQAQQSPAHVPTDTADDRPAASPKVIQVA